MSRRRRKKFKLNGMHIALALLVILTLGFEDLGLMSIYQEGARYGSSVLISDQTVEWGDTLTADFDVKMGGSCPYMGSDSSIQPKELRAKAYAIKVDGEWYFNNPKFGQDAVVENTLGKFIDENSRYLNCYQRYHSGFKLYWKQCSISSEATYDIVYSVPGRDGGHVSFDMNSNCKGNSYNGRFTHWLSPTAGVTRLNIDTSTLSPGKHRVELYALGRDTPILASHWYGINSQGNYHIPDYNKWCSYMNNYSQEKLIDNWEFIQVTKEHGLPITCSYGECPLATTSMCSEELTVDDETILGRNPLAYAEFYTTPPKCTFDPATEVQVHEVFFAGDTLSKSDLKYTPVGVCLDPSPVTMRSDVGEIYTDYDIATRLMNDESYTVPPGFLIQVYYIATAEETGVDIECEEGSWSANKEECRASTIVSPCDKGQWLENGNCVGQTDTDCPSGSYWNEEAGGCVYDLCAQVSNTAVWVESEQQCGEYVMFDTICPNQNYYYSWIDGKCFGKKSLGTDECGDFSTTEMHSYDVYDCPDGTYMGSEVGQCVKSLSEDDAAYEYTDGQLSISAHPSNEERQIYAEDCGAMGMSYDSSLGSCVETKTGTYEVCEAPPGAYGGLPEGTVFTQTDTGFFALYGATPSCDTGTIFDATLGKCVVSELQCGEGLVYNEETGFCEDPDTGGDGECPIGTYYSSDYDICVKDGGDLEPETVYETIYKTIYKDVDEDTKLITDETKGKIYAVLIGFGVVIVLLRSGKLSLRKLRFRRRH